MQFNVQCSELQKNIPQGLPYLEILVCIWLRETKSVIIIMISSFPFVLFVC